MATSLTRPRVEGVDLGRVSYVKNSKAQRSVYCRALASGQSLLKDESVSGAVHHGPDKTPIPYRLLLSGTMILNRPEELIHPLVILDRLKELGGWSLFTARYCQAYKDRFGWQMGGAAHLEELNTKLRASCYIRRNKADVLTELPEKTWSIVPVELS